MDVADWVAVVVAGSAGFGLGVGLVAAAYVVRLLRHYMRNGDPPDTERSTEHESGT